MYLMMLTMKETALYSILFIVFCVVSNSPLTLWLTIFWLIVDIFFDFNFHYCTGEMHLHREGKWCLSHLPGNDCFISHYCSNKGSKQTLMKSFRINGYPSEDELSGSKTLKKRYEKDLFWVILNYAMIWLTNSSTILLMLFYMSESNIQELL